MHLGDGQITTGCAVFGFAATAVGFAAARLLASLSKDAPKTTAPRFGAGVASVFAMQAFNITVLPGTSGHMVGSFLLAHWFGVPRALLGITLVLATQSLLFADGGMAALGLNILNMGIIPVLIAYPLVRALLRGQTSASLRYAVLGVGAFLSTLGAALACGLELSSTIGLNGTWAKLLPTLLGFHALIGLIEAGLTLGLVALVTHAPAFLKTSPVPAAIAAVALGSIAAIGASPWPDGLEQSLTLHGISPSATGLIATLEHLQSQFAPFADRYTSLTTAVGTLAVGVLAVISSRLALLTAGRTTDPAL
jgi:cobalt/nickel transport system permease protein